MKLQPVDRNSLTSDAFRAFESNDALLTAGDRAGCNTMTIGWCQVGRLWNAPVCTVYVRPERFTYQFMEDQAYFTVAILPAGEKRTMQVCGTQSGRDLDKFQSCGLTVAYGAGGAPFPQEAEWVLVCKKLYAQDLDGSHVTDGEKILGHYGAHGNWHRMYIGEILETYQRK